MVRYPTDGGGQASREERRDLIRIDASFDDVFGFERTGTHNSWNPKQE